MLTLAWIEHQIEMARNGPNEPQNVRDFALLCLAREFIKGEQMPAEKGVVSPNTRVVLTDYCADLNKVPKLEEIDAAIFSAAETAYTPADRQHVRDQKTWAEILRKN